jgi:hypothetical protein
MVGALVVMAMLGCFRPGVETPDVIVLHSGRMRGNVYPLSLQNLAPLQHYQYLAGYVAAVRAEAAKTGTRVFLVDLGDSMTGSFAASVTNSANMVDFFNEVGYDAVVLSNLDFAVPRDVLAKLRAKVLNPFSGPDGQPAGAPTAFGAQFADDRHPITLLANFYGDASREDFPERFPTVFGGAKVTPLRDYQKVIASLGPRPPNDLTMLTWMKFESPASQPEGFMNELRSVGVDVILAHRIYGGSMKDVWAASGYLPWSIPVSVNILRNNGGFALSRIDLKREGDGWKVLNHELLPMTANTAPPNENIVAAIEKFAGAIQAADRPLRPLDSDVPEHVVLATYLSALTTVPGAQAVLYSPESIRAGWSAGELRAGELYNSFPWSSGLVMVRLTRDQLAAAAGNSRVIVWSKGGTDDAVSVVTSRFFADLLQKQLGLGDDAVSPAGIASEFDYFANWLADNTNEVADQPPAGWAKVSPGTR